MPLLIHLRDRSNGTERLTRVVLHAGFPKSASSSIQGVIGNNTTLLAERSIFLLGEKLDVRLDGHFPGYPVWLLEQENEKAPPGQTLTNRILRSVAKCERSRPDPTLMITSENLSQIGMARLFTGLDDRVRVTVVFYFRPQTDWIASAWKQWGIKSNLSLEQFIVNSLKRKFPDYRSAIDEWARLLPKAEILVRPLVGELLRDGDPVRDFLYLIGAQDMQLKTGAPENPSFDYALMHILAHNSDELFSDLHDNTLFEALVQILPDHYLRAGAPMVSKKYIDIIEAFYRDDNLYILEKYCGLSGISLDTVYRKHFINYSETTSYMEMEEADVVARAAKIIFELSPDKKLVYRMLGGLVQSLALDPDPSARPVALGARLLKLLRAR